MKQEVTIIRIRRGIGEAKYVACEDNGTPIQGFLKLSDIRKHWQRAIKFGDVEFIRELDKTPDLEGIRKTIKELKAIIKSYAKQ